jgi:pectate lyase
MKHLSHSSWFLFLACLWFLGHPWPSTLAAAQWNNWAKQPDDWFRSVEAKRIIHSILSWQSEYGSWPKNMDTTAKPNTNDLKNIKGTFDNGATMNELRFLARAFRVTKDPRCEQALLQGIDGLLKAQYPTGGWPQFYPPSTQYHRHITFNDGSMVRVLQFLREVATSPDYACVDAARRKTAQESFDRGIQCVLKCQIVVNGKPTVWCAQHDEVDYRPRPGRSYELASLSGSESVAILHLLMSLDKPSPEMARAIQAGAEWFASSKITGIRVARVNGERVVVDDPSAPPLWARFYEIETNRPIFSGRDGVKKYRFAEIERERRNGYSWYGTWGETVAKDYTNWKTQRSK